MMPSNDGSAKRGKSAILRQLHNEILVLNRKQDTLLGKMIEIEERLERQQKVAEIQPGTCNNLGKKYLTTAEAAQLAGRSEYTIRDWVRQGLLSEHRLPPNCKKGRLAIDASELVALLDDDCFSVGT